MFKKLILFIFLLSFCQKSFSIESYENRQSYSQINCSPELRELINTIQKLPEVNQLISEIQKEGPISIVVNNTDTLKQFGAFWDPDQRVICLNLSDDSSKGTTIGSILFELQNALVNSKINYYDDLATRGKIDQESYVRAMEFLEYKNSINASAMAEKGIKLGIFPESARLPTYKNFEEHYYYQKEGGHSAWVESKFMQLSTQRN